MHIDAPEILTVKVCLENSFIPAQRGFYFMKQIKVPKSFFQPKNSYEQFAMQVYSLLVENFSQTFFVGGMVRNLFWKKKIADIDIATAAKPDQVIKLLLRYDYTLDTSAKKFGVVKLQRPSGTIEITTLRKEAYSSSRYPIVSWANSIKVDSKRRDFTLNSLYFNAKTNIVYDPQNSFKDLKLKQLRVIGNAEKRFQEDPLRLIRASRFIKQYNLKVEPKTKLALQKNFALVKTLTRSRIETEIQKCSTQSLKNFLTKKFV